MSSGIVSGATGKPFIVGLIQVFLPVCAKGKPFIVGLNDVFLAGSVQQASLEGSECYMTMCWSNEPHRLIETDRHPFIIGLAEASLMYLVQPALCYYGAEGCVSVLSGMTGIPSSWR